MGQSVLLNDTSCVAPGLNNSFDYIGEEAQSPPHSQNKIKSKFVLHSTDFGFITLLLDLKSSTIIIFIIFLVYSIFLCF